MYQPCEKSHRNQSLSKILLFVEDAYEDT